MTFFSLALLDSKDSAAAQVFAASVDMSAHSKGCRRSRCNCAARACSLLDAVARWQQYCTPKILQGPPLSCPPGNPGSTAGRSLCPGFCINECSGR